MVYPPVSNCMVLPFVVLNGIPSYFELYGFTLCGVKWYTLLFGIVWFYPVYPPVWNCMVLPFVVLNGIPSRIVWFCPLLLNGIPSCFELYGFTLCGVKWYTLLFRIVWFYPLWC